MKRSLLVLTLLASGCVPIYVPPVIVPLPPLPSSKPVLLNSNVSVYDEAGAPVTDVECALEHDRDPSDEKQHVSEGTTGWRATFWYESPPVHQGWGAQIVCKSPNYLTTVARYDPLPTGELPFITMKGAHTWGDEAGPLHVEGPSFKTAEGREWRYKGYTAFKLLQQQCEGGNIDAFVEEAVSVGARIFRVFGMYEPWIGTFTLARDDLLHYDTCLLDLVHYLRDRGLRMQFVVFADAQTVMSSTSAQLRHFEHISSLLANECNVLGSLVNEWSKNGVDPTHFTKPTGTCVLWSRGSGLGRDDPPIPAWDYVDYHEGRGDDYPRLNECREYTTNPNSPVRGIPCVQDEPIGASELHQPGRRVGAIAGDVQSIERAINGFAQMGANYGLQSNGGLFHSDAGIAGGPLGNGLQKQMAMAFFRGLNFAPPEAHLWPYQRGGNCGDCDGIGAMPIQQLDEFEARGYCRGNGNMAWCAAIQNTDRNRRTRDVLPRAGWRIVDQPSPGLVRLTR